MKRILQLLLVGIMALLGSMLMFGLILDGFYPLASFVGACIVFFVYVFLKKSLVPYRWMAAGIVLAFIFTVFPIVYTVYLSFTNMSGGHMHTKQQAIHSLEGQTYVAEDSPKYSWTLYKGTAGNYELLITPLAAYDESEDAVSDESALAEEAAVPAEAAPVYSVIQPGKAIVVRSEITEIPETLDGCAQIDPIDVLANIEEYGKLQFGVAPNIITIQSLDEASAQKPLYAYDGKKDAFTDNQTGIVYSVKDSGSYVSDSGEALVPGFIKNVGVENYGQFLGNEGYRKPVLEILIWNIMFTVLSVFFSFALGMIIALVFEDLPGKRLIRTLLILPYPIPVLVMLMVWRGLFNEQMGPVTMLITQIFGFSPKFFTDTNWCRFAIILLNVYLSYPYFYILSSGALKSIPGDLFEAAEIDGSGPVNTLIHITLPMLLRILAPLIIASLSFNFNNFTLIWGFNAGLPAMTDTILPMGHTDLLVSFIYRLGFGSAGAPDYGFIGAITVILFVFVAATVFYQTSNTKAIKETK